MTRQTGDGSFSLGSRVWPGLSKVIEECGEVLTEAGKLIGSSGKVEHWDGKGLLDERIGCEIVDVFAATRAFFALNGYAGNVELMEREQTKYLQFLKWHADNVKEPDDAVTEEIEAVEATLNRERPPVGSKWRHADGGHYVVRGYSMEKDRFNSQWYLSVKYDHADGTQNAYGLEYGTDLRRWYERFEPVPVNPVSALREIAEQIAEQTGLEVDHALFDRQRAYLIEEVAADHGLGEYPDPDKLNG